jgi:purine-binding chemotaxis protein CheW
VDFKELRRRMRKGEAPAGTRPAPAAAADEPVLLPSALPRLPAEVADAAPPATPAKGPSAAAAVVEEAAVQRREILRFRLHDERFAIDLDRVEEIIKPRRFTDVPRAPEWILGILSLRGTMIPVIDLASRLGFRARESAGQRIIVVRDGEDQCGLLVDEVRDVERIADRDVESVPAGLAGTAGRFLSGLVRQADDEDGDEGSDLLAIVDLAEILIWEDRV